MRRSCRGHRSVPIMQVEPSSPSVPEIPLSCESRSEERAARINLELVAPSSDSFAGGDRE